MKKITAAVLMGTVAVVGFAAPDSFGGSQAAVAVVPVPAMACGQVLVPGSSWLGGAGVDAKYNLRVNGSLKSCNGISTTNPSVQNGGGWQCVELAARLYAVKGWGAVWAGGDGGAQYIPEGSPWLSFQANGSGYVPVPGDLIIETGGTYGHVSVVDTVSASTISTVEQNASVTGRHDYPFVGGVATGSYAGVVRGFMHSALNGGVNPVPVLPPPAASKLAAVRALKRRVSVKWKPADSALRITSYEVRYRKYGRKKRSLGVGQTITASATATSQMIRGLTAGRKYRIDVRAGNSGGYGNWSLGQNAVPTA